MAKALLQQHAAKAIREREEQEKAIAKKIETAKPQVIITPPVSAPATAPVVAPVKTSPPVVINQTIILPNNKAAEEIAQAKEDVAKTNLKAEKLRLENERIAMEKQALEKENASLKLKYELALKEVQEKEVQEQARLDIEEQFKNEQLTKKEELEREIATSEKIHHLMLEENEQLVRRVSQENCEIKKG